MVKLEEFKSGEIRKSIDYKYFLPSLINSELTWSDPKLNNLLEKASYELGQLNSFAKLVPNVDLFIHLHITKESVVSSRIEGTQTQFDEAFLQIENINPERKDDWQEIQNYTNALNSAISELETLPTSSRLILKAHKIFMQGVRGNKKTPGEYRRSQNWIGGKSLSDAAFIPPHPDHLNELIGDLENFIHNEDLEIPILIKSAIMHYQFETIHPFLDGNGRIGRLLIILFLIEKKVIEKPLLYLSSYFEKDRNMYYDSLTKVRTQNDIIQWIKYFLTGIASTSKQATTTLKQVIDLKSAHEKIIQEKFGRRIKSGLILLNYLFKQPLISVKEVQKVCSLSSKSANLLITIFIEVGFLKEFTEKFRNRIFVYYPYLNLFED